MRTIALVVAIALCAPASASDYRLTEVTAHAGAGRSSTSPHGQARFRVIEVQALGHSDWIARWVPKTDAGFSLTYGDIRQPRSWFGHRYGDPDDSVRGEWAYFFLRRTWRDGTATRPYVELGSGPMWSNRRVPAATSRFNFNSQLGLGIRLFANRQPIDVVYRFSHISNLVFGPHNPDAGKRNPGWNVSTILVGTRLHRFGR